MIAVLIAIVGEIVLLIVIVIAILTAIGTVKVMVAPAHIQHVIDMAKGDVLQRGEGRVEGG